MLEDRLAEQAETAGKEGPWIVGHRMTIADVANFAWVNWAEWAGIDVKPFRHLSQWLDRINERPTVKRGLDVPEPFVMKEKLKSKVSFPVFQRSTAKTQSTGGRRRLCQAS